MGTVLGKVVTVDGHKVKTKRQIAEGGFSFVYLGTDVGTGEKVVLKRMRIANDNDAMLRLARAEIAVMRGLPPHPHIVRYIASSVTPAADGEFTDAQIVMEYCGGGTALDLMQSYVDRRVAMPEALVLRLFQGVCLAVSHLHAQSPPVIHRDIKVENMLLTTSGGGTSNAVAGGGGAVSTSGEGSAGGGGGAGAGGHARGGRDTGGVVKLCDFGSCTRTAKVFTTAREIAHEAEMVERYTTINYRAPEQVDLHARKHVGTGVDVWALGCVLFKLAYLRTPFEDARGNVQRMGILSGRYRIPASMRTRYSQGLNDMIAAALRPDPAARPSVAELIRMGEGLAEWPTTERVPGRSRSLVADAGFEAGGVGGGQDAALGALGSPIRSATSPPGAMVREWADAAAARDVGDAGKERKQGARRVASASAGTSDAAAGTAFDAAFEPFGSDDTSVAAGSSSASAAGARGGDGLAAADSAAGATGSDFWGFGGAEGAVSSLGLAWEDDTGDNGGRGGSSTAASTAASSTTAPTRTSGARPSRGSQRRAGGRGGGSGGGGRGGGRELQRVPSDDSLGGDGLDRGSSSGGGGGDAVRLSPINVSSEVASSSSVTADDNWARSNDTPAVRGNGPHMSTHGHVHQGGRRVPPPPPSHVDESVGVVGAVESVTGRVFQLLGGSSQKRRWVLRCTSRDPGVPKQKYVRRLILDAWETRSLASWVHHLPSRPVTTHPVVAVKAVVTMLKLLQLGPPGTPAMGLALLPVFEGMSHAWRQIHDADLADAGSGVSIMQYVAEYAAYVSQRLQFHRAFPQFDAQFVVPEDSASASGGGDTSGGDATTDGTAVGGAGDRKASDSVLPPKRPATPPRLFPLSGPEWLACIDVMLQQCRRIEFLQQAAFAIVDSHARLSAKAGEAGGEGSAAAGSSDWRSGGAQASVPAAATARAAVAAAGSNGSGTDTDDDEDHHDLHPEAVCAVSGVPVLVPESLALYRGVYLALAHVGADGRGAGLRRSKETADKVKSLRDEFDDLRPRVAAFYSQVRRYADEFPQLAVLDSVPALPSSSPLTDKRAAMALVAAKRAIPLRDAGVGGGTGYNVDAALDAAAADGGELAGAAGGGAAAAAEADHASDADADASDGGPDRSTPGVLAPFDGDSPWSPDSPAPNFDGIPGIDTSGGAAAAAVSAAGTGSGPRGTFGETRDGAAGGSVDPAAAGAAAVADSSASAAGGKSKGRPRTGSWRLRGRSGDAVAAASPAASTLLDAGDDRAVADGASMFASLPGAGAGSGTAAAAGAAGDAAFPLTSGAASDREPESAMFAAQFSAAGGSVGAAAAAASTSGAPVGEFDPFSSRDGGGAGVGSSVFGSTTAGGVLSGSGGAFAGGFPSPTVAVSDAADGGLASLVGGTGEGGAAAGGDVGSSGGDFGAFNSGVFRSNPSPVDLRAAGGVGAALLGQAATAATGGAAASTAPAPPALAAASPAAQLVSRSGSYDPFASGAGSHGSSSGAAADDKGANAAAAALRGPPTAPAPPSTLRASVAGSRASGPGRGSIDTSYTSLGLRNSQSSTSSSIWKTANPLPSDVMSQWLSQLPTAPADARPQLASRGGNPEGPPHGVGVAAAAASAAASAARGVPASPPAPAAATAGPVAARVVNPFDTGASAAAAAARGGHGRRGSRERLALGREPAAMAALDSGAGTDFFGGLLPTAGAAAAGAPATASTIAAARTTTAAATTLAATAPAVAAGSGAAASPTPGAPQIGAHGRDTGMWPAEVEIPFSSLVLTAQIGTGGFSEVYKGTYGGQEVAVKRLLYKPGEAGDRALRDFKAEVLLMARMNHPCILGFLGVVPSPLCLVSEYCSNGNLFDLLHNSPVRLPWHLRLRMALEVAEGMKFLHSTTPVIIHRDLKSLNLLVDRDWHVKVSDFGLSRFKALSSSAFMTAQCGTFHWMAPEVIAGHRYTESADVYSFGINLWELLTRKVPYKGLEPMQVGIAVYTRGERPPIPRDCPAAFAALMQACWHAEPSCRPTFVQLVPVLKQMTAQATAEHEAAATTASLASPSAAAAAAAAASVSVAGARLGSSGTSSSGGARASIKASLLAGGGGGDRASLL